MPGTIPEPGTSIGEPEPVFELADARPVEAAPHAAVPEPLEPEAPAPLAPAQRSASPVSVHQAIEEVNVVVDSLRHALDDMEEVLEMLELFERQQNADEREIESLRRALRQMHRPREGGHSR